MKVEYLIKYGTQWSRFGLMLLVTGCFLFFSRPDWDYRFPVDIVGYVCESCVDRREPAYDAFISCDCEDEWAELTHSQEYEEDCQGYEDCEQCFIQSRDGHRRAREPSLLLIKSNLALER